MLYYSSLLSPTQVNSSKGLGETRFLAGIGWNSAEGEVA